MDEPAHPRLEEEETRVYLIDQEGTRWRVHDVAYGPPLAAPHHRRAFRPPDRRANYRYFVREDGLLRCVPLTPDTRDLRLETVAKQLAEAGYVARSAFDPSTRDPRWLKRGTPDR